MRRRIVVTIVGTVVAALVLAGLGTLVLARFGARRYAEAELRTQVETVAEALATDRPLVSGGADRPRVLAAFRRALRLEGMGLLALKPNGEVAGQTPEGITLDAADVRALRAGETISGREGRLVYAGTTFRRGNTVTAVVLSDRIDIAPGGTVVWFLLAAGAVIALAVVVAVRLARALTEPLRRAEDASRLIAAGDLTARVPEPADDALDEVADLSRSINAMAGALERSRGLEQQFLLSVSHDLRTPLTSIQGFAEALSDGTIDDAPRAGSVILGEAQRLHRLVRDLLELARLDAHRFSLEATAVELHDLVEACVEGFGPEADAAGIMVEVVAPPAVVTADPDRLAQVVANLLDNALKFADRRVLVSVTVWTVARRVRVTVEDDGPGIDPADRPHVFERLYQARHRPVRKESGSGLGLAIVRELVVAMGGVVGVDAVDGGGARLWFELPLTGPEHPAHRFVRSMVDGGTVLLRHRRPRQTRTQIQTDAETRSAVAHLVRRIAFGAPAGQIDELAALGYEGAVDRLCDLTGPDPAADAVPVPTFDTAGYLAGRKGDDAERREAARLAASERRALPLWWVKRMVVADRPVREKLTFLWHDHFATSIEKVKVAELLYRQRQTLYDLGPGRFDELVGAVARDPAMLVWLDGRENRAGAPNENFARELMELFTLGHGLSHGDGHADQPYTEDDVAEAGRALTGWTTNRRGQSGFDPSRHDAGTKTVLGTTGALGLDEIVAVTTRHPACAPHVVSRLWSRIARPAGPDDPVVQDLAAGFATDLDVSALLRRMVLHPDFLAPATRTALVRTPVDYVVGIARTLGFVPDKPALKVLAGLGQLPFLPPDVSGWPANEAWLSTASALGRLQMASAVAERVEADELVGADPGRRAPNLARLLGVDGWGPATTAALLAAPGPADALTIALVAPEHLVA